VPEWAERTIRNAFICYKLGKFPREGDLREQDPKELAVLFDIIRLIDAQEKITFCQMIFGKN